MGWEFGLIAADERVADGTGAIDEKDGDSGDIPAGQPGAVPHTVGLHDVTSFVDENVVRKSGLFDVAAYRSGPLREDGDELYASSFVFLYVLCQFTEPAAAVRSPRASMKREQHGTTLEKTLQRTAFALLRRKFECWSNCRQSTTF